MQLTELSNLAVALDVDRGELISIVGGGGKTTTLFALGEQLRGTTVLTTTTKMGAEQSAGYPVLLDPTNEQLQAELAASSRSLAWKAADDRRAIGVSGETCDRWFDIADNVVVEADGSRKRPFKAPAAHEPVIPSRTTLMIACVGARAFGQPIVESCHRPDLVANLAECTVDDELTAARAAKVLLSDAGSRKGLPPGARFVVQVCRVGPTHRDAVHKLAAELAGAATLLAIADSSS